MKICVINFDYPPYIAGGSGVSTATIAKALKERGHDIFIITTCPFKNFDSFRASIRVIDGIKVYHFYPLFTYMPFYTKKISNIGRICTFLSNFWNPHTYFIVRKILKKENPDIVYTNELPYLSLSVFSAVKSLNLPIIHVVRSVILLFPYNNLPYLDKIAGVTYAFIKNNYKVYTIISKIYAKINKIIIGDLKYVLFPSNAIKTIYSNYGFFKKSKKIIFPNLFKINESVQKKLNKETFDIFYMGGLDRIKGVGTLIKAFKEIENETIRLHILGKGVDEKYFKEIAKGDKRIIFYGWIPNDEIQKFYKNADVVVVPSIYYESFSRVTCEALMSGTPVIGSNIGGIPELIKDGYNGFLFEPGNANELRKILEKIIENPKQLEELSKNAFESVKKYSMDKHIEKLINIYKEAIELNK